jgi:hypothetical protein
MVHEQQSGHPDRAREGAAVDTGYAYDVASMWGVHHLPASKA